jgi:hypothetical protein
MKQIDDLALEEQQGARQPLFRTSSSPRRWIQQLRRNQTQHLHASIYHSTSRPGWPRSDLPAVPSKITLKTRARLHLVALTSGLEPKYRATAWPSPMERPRDALPCPFILYEKCAATVVDVSGGGGQEQGMGWGSGGLTGSRCGVSRVARAGHVSEYTCLNMTCVWTQS